VGSKVICNVTVNQTEIGWSQLPMDVLLIFGISKTSLYIVFHEVDVWIVKTLKFPLTDWIVGKNEEALNLLSEAFLEASGGIFRKCIGALDGIAIKVKAPS
jgi:hypothetical protein